ncbi:MAG: T9SS type A sorting domain-containing protein [Saprospiraceae bacterium]
MISSSKYFVFFVLFTVIQFQTLKAQCGAGGIVLNSQAEVDNFNVTYPNCHRVLGNLSLELTDITNLDGLSAIDSIDLSFNITNNTNLIDIEGLHNLKFVQDFTLANSPLLDNITGLRNLHSASNSFYLNNLFSLNDLTGLGRLTYARQFIIAACNKLTNLTGLDSLIETSTFTISENKNLASLNGLPKDFSVSQLSIYSNPILKDLSTLIGLKDIYQLVLNKNKSLKNLNGLDSLNSISFLSIKSNDSLASFPALSNLKTIKIALFLEDNLQLKDISGLQNINFAKTDSIIIVNNPQLSFCSYPNFCKYLSDLTHVSRINGNSLDCLNKSSILAKCLILTSQEINSNYKINIFPNPTQGSIHISGLTNLSRIQIFNSQSQLTINESTSKSELDLSLEHLEDGLYFIRILDGKLNYFFGKILVNRS